MQTMTATKFKATCLQVMDEVNRTGEPVSITKHGQITAILTSPAPERVRDYTPGKCAGTITYIGDIMESVVSEEDFDLESPWF
jgi:prevent-host-death family protein